ncbi:MAG TPA: hypothetical protein VLS49_16490 [Usitatibacter sp.]|nr:hypothetical protein [Usitatibacter sp.]
MKNRCLVLSAIAAATLIPPFALADAPGGSALRLVPNAAGVAATLNAAGRIDTSNPFFQSLGTNGRSCATCHDPNDGWTVTPASLQRRFLETQGLDPIFRPVDGANSPNADLSTVAARRSAYSMLLRKGLIRVGIGIPPGAEFELASVDDPYGYASAAQLSLFRRPLPSANLAFLSTVMWDGRETFADPSSSNCIKGTTRCFASIAFDLSDQANGATLGHAQAAQPLTDAQREAIVRFESGLYTAQVFDKAAKDLTSWGAHGGPLALTQMPSYFGINDVVDGDYRTGTPFDPQVFRLFQAWAGETQDGDDQAAKARHAVARGEALFNGKTIHIAGVKGLNDELGMPVIDGTCSTCHDAPGAGSHSIPAPLDIGIADGARATPDMPLYVLRNKTTGETIATTDPGRALITGKWKDIGKFKGPVLRALATRAPYFHNGSAADLGAVVDFYNQRFSIGLTAAERADLVAFLRSL